MKFSAKYFSWRDSFSLCKKNPKPAQALAGSTNGFADFLSINRRFARIRFLKILKIDRTSGFLKKKMGDLQAQQSFFIRGESCLGVSHSEFMKNESASPTRMFRR